MSTITSTTWKIDRHTKAKHKILENYLKAWFPILTSRSGKIIYLDGFAGPGIYKGGELGSPVIAIITAEDHKLQSKFNEIIFLFIESKKDRAIKLKEVLEDQFPQLPENMHYSIHGGKFAPKLESVLNDIKSRETRLAPTFAPLKYLG